MTSPWLLAYAFVTLLVGTACIGATAVESRRGNANLARAFLLFLSALTVLVLGRLLLAYIDSAPFVVSSRTLSFVSYVEAFLGRYGLMFTLPYVAHRAFGVRHRDAAVGIVVLAAAALQHVTEFGLGGSLWDDGGDVVEDVLLASVFGYSLWIGLTRRRSAAAEPFAGRFLAILVIAVPAIAYDLFLSEGSGWRLYPLWYCVAGPMLTAALISRRGEVEPSVPAAWELTAREMEIARLVQQGLSNPAIARALFISPNTVKTHLRSIFDKSGVRTRAAVIAALSRRTEDFSRQEHPIG